MALSGDIRRLEENGAIHGEKSDQLSEHATLAKQSNAKDNRNPDWNDQAVKPQTYAGHLSPEEKRNPQKKAATTDDLRPLHRIAQHRQVGMDAREALRRIVRIQVIQMAVNECPDTDQCDRNGRFSPLTARDSRQSLDIEKHQWGDKNNCLSIEAGQEEDRDEKKILSGKAEVDAKSKKRCGQK